MDSVILDAGREPDAASRGCELYVAPKRRWKSSDCPAQRRPLARRFGQNVKPARTKTRIRVANNAMAPRPVKSVFSNIMTNGLVFYPV